ncbi:MAG: isoleucine--tRNA ligase [Candidatus Dormibacteria bacterium]
MPVFDPLPPHLSLPDLEERVLESWERQQIFQAGLEQNRDGAPFVFYEGPPTANGIPGVHHVLARSFKDCFMRYQQMLGRRVERRGGWDTHGLPVELEVERSLKLRSKGDIEEFGVEEFNRLCRASVTEYIDEWERLTSRIGFWLDMDRAYRTCDASYIESVWWSLKQIFDHGWLYRGYRVAPYCPRCQTSLSSHELGQPGAYRDDTPDPAVTVRFRLRADPSTSLLAWTTTPWTLPGNLALAVGRDITYVRVRQGDERLILAKARLSMLDGDFEVEQELQGSELVGLAYERLYPYLPAQEGAWQVLEADFVAADEGTGIVHTSAVYGEDDLRLCQQAGLEVIHTVGLDGRFLPFVEQFAGRFFKEADAAIQDDLRERGLLYQQERILHTYPFCWRCETPLIYYALDSWFIRTTAVKEALLRHNQSVRWVPSHIRDGRMGNWLESLQDWNLSRARYWGTPLPIWVCPGCQRERCVGSFQELGLPADFDPHKPFIDEVTIPCSCGESMRRVPEVIDCWYDSGAMPYAQWHYPFENQERFQQQHPADYICEALDQTRGWFYTLLAESTMLFDQPAYRNVVVPSLVVDEQGRKMSKTRGNVIDPWALISKTGADAVRWWFYTTVTVGQEYRISVQRVMESAVKFLNVLWNTQSFLVTYANLAEWSPDGREPSGDHVLDRWILARLDATVAEVVRHLDRYDAYSACRAIQHLADDTSTWYLRCSRPRFRGESEAAASAFATLWRVLRDTALLMAPFAPFVADAIHSELTTPLPGSPISVHLARYPQAGPRWSDPELVSEMAEVRRLTEDARSQREAAGVPIRQPLREAVVTGVQLASELAQVLAQEINVQKVTCRPGGESGRPQLQLDFELTPELRREGLLRQVVRQVQSLRKQSGMNPGEPARLLISTEAPELVEAVRSGNDQLRTQCFLSGIELAALESATAGRAWREVAFQDHRAQMLLVPDSSGPHGSDSAPADGP